LIRDFEKAYEKVDVIFTPSTGIEASSIREEQAPGGVPARAVPAGHITPGEMSWRMPSPANLAGAAYERATDWHTRKPKFLHMSRG
jgi:Asp-tRNA(Asn)/Glu-tRNA(Gln) amidotransferase A subunit family amidase